MHAVRGDDSRTVNERLQGLDEDVEEVVRSYMLEEIDTDAAHDRVESLQHSLREQEDTTATLLARNQKLEREHRDSDGASRRLLLLSSVAPQSHLLRVAAEPRAVVAEFEWAGTSRRRLLDLVAEERRTHVERWNSIALWVQKTPVVDEMSVVRGHDLSLEELAREAAEGPGGMLRFWHELGELIVPNGHLLLLGVDDADWAASPARERLLMELSTAVGREVVVPHVLHRGALIRDADGALDPFFAEFFSDQLLGRWSAAAALSVAAEWGPLDADNQRAIDARARKERFEQEESEAARQHEADMRREDRNDRRLELERTRMEAAAELESRLGGSNSEADFSSVVRSLHDGGLHTAQLLVAVDFSRSNQWNGRKSFGGRGLHDTLTAGVPTPYETVLEALATVMGEFDDADATIPFHGFGHAEGDLFSLAEGGGDCLDMADLLRRYRRVARDVVPDGERIGAASLTPVIDLTIQEMNRRRGADESFEQLHVLLLVTDSDIPRPAGLAPSEWSKEEAAFIDAVRRASYFPLSVLVVGVGDGLSADADTPAASDTRPGAPKSFSSLRQMGRGMHHRGGFENFHFVELGSAALDNAATLRFAQQALGKLPAQWRTIQRLGIHDEQGDYAQLAMAGSPRLPIQPAGPPPENEDVAAQSRRRRAEVGYTRSHALTHHCPPHSHAASLAWIGSRKSRLLVRC